MYSIERTDGTRTFRAERLRPASSFKTPDELIIGRSPSIVRLQSRIEMLADSDAAVLITGETGTGKELVARALHLRSSRRNRPFVAVNCAAFPETLLEAELFGHHKGAFTGASHKREGRFKEADGGTILLDEIGDLPLTAQVKLLRVLEEGTYEPLGTNTTTRVCCRILTSTHRDLKERIANGLFREDLYYRIRVMNIHVPSLRERRGDIQLLTEHFLSRFSGPNLTPPSLTPQAWAALNQYPFPGNVRELRHAIQHALLLSGGQAIDLDHLPDDIAAVALDLPEPSSDFRSLDAATREFEREYLLRALRLADGKKTRAADILGISRKNLWEKLRSHHLGAEWIDG